MKKVISIVLALALVLSLSIAATPALADVTAATVVVDPATVNTVASYTITFNITATLGHANTVSVEFPTNTVVPTTYAVGAVRVQTTDIGPGDIIVSGQVVTIRLPIAIPVPPEGSAEVVVMFKTEAGIKNPTTQKQYQLRVHTSSETKWVTSKPYGISLPAHSEYEFLYAPPALISQDAPAEVNVTLKFKVLGSNGYSDARIYFEGESAPSGGSVNFSVKYGETWSSPAPSGSYPSSPFVLANNANEIIHFRLTFSEVGLYALNFTLVAGDETLIADTPTFTCAGVSETVDLKKGWNLISLPIIPVNSAITAVLADIMDDVNSVWYYNPTITDPNKRWQSYVPGGPTPTLTKIEDGKAYWIDMKAEPASPLIVAGVAIVLPGELPPTYSVREGWNMVGFKSRDAMSVGDYLAGTKAVRVLEFKNGVWSSLPLLTGSHNMTPGLGYWVAFSEPGVIYP